MQKFFYFYCGITTHNNVPPSIVILALFGLKHEVNTRLIQIIFITLKHFRNKKNSQILFNLQTKLNYPHLHICTSSMSISYLLKIIIIATLEGNNFLQGKCGTQKYISFISVAASLHKPMFHHHFFPCIICFQTWITWQNWYKLKCPAIGSGSQMVFSSRGWACFFKKGIGSSFGPYIMKKKMNTPENCFEKSKPLSIAIFLYIPILFNDKYHVRVFQGM